ncbi:MAG: hypothetical protein AAF253_05675 [Pseudomonadota bacterium]
MVDLATDRRARIAVVTAGVAVVHVGVIVGASTLGTGGLRPSPAAPAPLVVGFVSEPEPEPVSRVDPVAPLVSVPVEDVPREGKPAPGGAERQAAPTDRRRADAEDGLGDDAVTVIMPPAEPGRASGPGEAAGSPAIAPTIAPDMQDAVRRALCAVTTQDRPAYCDTPAAAAFAAMGAPDRFDPADPPLPQVAFSAFVDAPARAPGAARYPGQGACVSPEGGMLPGAEQGDNRAFLPNAAKGSAVLVAKADRVWCD